MKKLFPLFAFFLIISIISCNGGKSNSTIGHSKDSDAVEADASDSTIFGVCGESTGMSTMQLLTDAGDTLDLLIDDNPEQPVVKGGVFAGDKMAVTAVKENGEWIATNAINLSSLIGKWTSIDKNFEILEGGVVKSNVKAESEPWTSWKIYNCKLILNRDTFDVDNLGADSLYLENDKGIYTFKRLKEK